MSYSNMPKLLLKLIRAIDENDVKKAMEVVDEMKIIMDTYKDAC